MTNNCAEEKATVQALQSVYDHRRRELGSVVMGSNGLAKMERAQVELRHIAGQLTMANARLEECLNRAKSQG